MEGEMIPEIGSEWKAKDGRRMRVLRIIDPGIGQKCPRAIMFVLNAGYRMKGFTEIATSNFGLYPPAFLIPDAEVDSLKRTSGEG